MDKISTILVKVYFLWMDKATGAGSLFACSQLKY